MQTCPECGAKVETLIACRACPLACCYDCALINPDCERTSDQWPVVKEDLAPSGKKKAFTGRYAPRIIRRPVGLSHTSVNGHSWGAAF